MYIRQFSGVPKTTLTSDTRCKLESFLRFCILLEGFTELVKAVILTVMVYYSEKIQIKVNQGVQEDMKCEPSIVLSIETGW